jgi:hypothetical protein
LLRKEPPLSLCVHNLKRIYSLLSIFYLLIFVALANCETVQIYGVNFPVDYIKEEKNDLFELSIFNTKHIASQNEINATITDSYFNTGSADEIKSKAAQFSTTSLKEFVEKALLKKDLQNAVNGAFALCLHPDFSVSDFEELLSEVFNLSIGQDFIALLEALCLRLNVENPKSLVVHFFFFYSRNETLNDFSKALTVSDQLILEKIAITQVARFAFNGDRMAARKLGQMQAEFSELSKEDIRTLMMGIDEVASLVQSIQRGKGSNITTLTKVAKTNKFLSKNSDQFIQALGLKEIKKLINVQNYLAALELMPKVIFEKTPIEFEKYLITSLSKISQVERSPLLSITGLSNLVINQLKTSTDPKFSNIIVDHVHKQILNSISHNRTSDLPILFEILTTFNKDPSILNDSLRIKWAEYYIERNLKAEASNVLSKLSGSLPYASRVKFFILQSYLDGPKRFLFLFAGSGFALLAALMFSVYGVVRKAVSSHEEVQQVMSYKHPLFVRNNSGTKMNPILQEYAACIRTLQVKPGVSVKEIKKAYRACSKLYHPDTGANPSNEKFLELTTSYERLIEIEEGNMLTSKEKKSLNLLGF